MPAARRLRELGRLAGADYRAQHPAGAGSMREAALLGPRLLTDPSLHAVLLVRGVAAAPPPLRGVLQRVLLCLHATYVEPGVAIGPGLVLKHPVAIVIGRGTTIGAGVSIFQDVTLRAGAAGGDGAPSIGDGVRIFTGAVVSGPVHVGDGAMVGAGVMALADVAPAGRVVRTHGTPDGGDPVLGRAPGAGPAAADGGLLATLRADHADRFGADGAAGAGLLARLRADHAGRFGTGRATGAGRLARDAVADRGFRVTVIARLMWGGPRPLRRLWRRVLVGHGCDIGLDATAAPGLDIPCPVGVVIGRRSRLGAGVQLLEHTCVTPTRTRWQPAAAGNGMVVGDGVRVLPGAGAFGDLEIGGRAILAPRALVTRDVAPPPGAAAPGHPTPPAPGPSSHGPGRHAAAADPGFWTLVRADLRRLTAATTGPRARVRAATGLPFQAAVLVRTATAGPAWLATPARIALRALHHCYVDAGVHIGPGLLLPLPCGIRIEAGVRIGDGVTIYDRVSLRSDLLTGGTGETPRVADGAVVGSGAVVMGACTVEGEHTCH